MRPPYQCRDPGSAGAGPTVRWPYLLPVFAFQVAVSALYIAAFLRARAFEHATAPAGRDASASNRPLITRTRAC